MASSPDELDQLLDSALDDFKTLNLASIQRNEDKTFQGKGKKQSLPTNVQGLGLGLGLPGLKSKRKGTHKDSINNDSHVFETLNQLRQQTRDAVNNIESISGGSKLGDDLSTDAMMEEWVKQFEDLSASQDMESMMDAMMHQLLSKDILYEPMKEIGERYPTWLQEHKTSLSDEDYKRYSNQYELIQELNLVYDSDPGNFTKIVDLMQKMQECGQPPIDIVNELAPGFDISNLGQLSPDMLEAQPNCSIM